MPTTSPTPTTEPEPMKKERSATIEELNVPRDCSLLELIEDVHNKKYRPGCAFFELTGEECENINWGKEVILMTEVGACYVFCYIPVE